MAKEDRLSTTFCGLRFENPFVLAASPSTDELEMVKNGFRAGWAGAVLKTTHVERYVINYVRELGRKRRPDYSKIPKT